jgi:hypothetical protein
VAVDTQDKQKTAFTTGRGLYAPAIFERLMETVLRGLQFEICVIYLEDIIVFGKNFEDMVENLSRVFDRLEDAGL